MDEGTNSRRRSFSPEGKPAHFFKIILPTTILDKKMRVPKTFVNHHGNDFSTIITLHDPNAREWKIGLDKNEDDDDDVWFSEGWDKFLEYYSITKEHFLVFRYEGESRFRVLIFDMGGSEIQYPSPEKNQVASVESSKSKDHDHEKVGPSTQQGSHRVECKEMQSNRLSPVFNPVTSKSHDNNNEHDHHRSQNNNDDDDGIGNHFTEEYFPDDEDDSTHAYEEDKFYYRTCSSESTPTSPSKSIPSTKRRGFTKFIDQASKTKRRKRSSDCGSDDHSDGGSNRRRKGRRIRRSKEGRRRGRGRENKEDQVKQTVKSKSYKKRHISDRLRAKVIQAADKYRSEFPSFRAVLRPHNFYNNFVYVPARFGVKYMGGGSEKIKLENVKGKQWEARCFYRNGSGNGMNIGEGWAEFKTENAVKEGDVCVFELVKKKDIVLRVQIFRVRHFADR